MRYVSDIVTDNAEYIYNRYGSDQVAQNSTDSTYTTPDFTYSADSKLIDMEAISADRISHKELSRQGFDIVADRTDKHAYAIAQAVHRHAARTTRIGAGKLLDNEVLAGTASNGTVITLSDSNPDNVAATAVQLLQEGNAFTQGNPYAMMTPKQGKNFNLFSMGAGFSNADKALTNGVFTVGGGTRIIRGSMAFGGLDIIVTNEMPRTAILTLADETDATDTVVINGVTLTCDATPNAAGEYDQGADAEGTIDALVALINNSENAAASTASASGEYVELSASNRAIFDNAGIKARKLSSTTMEVESFGPLTVSETGDESSWSAVREHMLVGGYNSTTIALPSKGANVTEEKVENFNGIELMYAQQHDAVVWTKDAPKIINVITA